MNAAPGPVFYAGLMLAAGIGIPIMAALNSGLGAKLGSPALATCVLFIVGGVLSLAFLFLSGAASKFDYAAAIPVYYYLGGLFIVFYVLAITWVAPRFGIGNAITFVLLGQLISMTTIDHFGLLGAPMHPLSMQRAVGLIFMVLGVLLIVRRH